MNPPFAAKKTALVKISLSSKLGGISYVPVESAFVWRAVQLLRCGGRLLAILPPSVISSFQGTRLRQWLLQEGSILYVHELPRRTFPEVESRVYLFVFEKGTSSRSLMLCNHDIVLPERRQFRVRDLGPEVRFDFNSCNATKNLLRIRNGPSIQWERLGNVATVYRGSRRSPDAKGYAIHSSDFRDGFWRIAKRHRRFGPHVRDLVLQKGDILLQRVGRNAAKRLGVTRQYPRVALSDCMLLIRPYEIEDSVRILFALRCLAANDHLGLVLERGTGAMYIAMKDLLRLSIPLGAAEHVPQLFRSYVECIQSGSFDKMTGIEMQAAQEVGLKTRLVGLSE